MSVKKKILIAPLDWGLGHTTRCIPIIEALIKRGHKVYSCGNKNSELIFKEHFPKLHHIIIDGYQPRYSKGNNQGLSMLVQSPKFFKRIIQEKKTAEEIVSKFKIDYIISDSRFGFRSSRTTNVFISHQIHIQGPGFLKPLFLKINLKFINNFHYCWIPDYSDNSLSGKLTQNPLPKNTSFIGPVSRFNQNAENNKEKIFKYLGIISGPEPQRSMLENILFRELSKENFKCAIIGGNINKSVHTKNNISYFPHLSTDAFFKLISESGSIICRPGYSSIMDLHILNKKAVFIPTPGQTEQEYLAKYHSQKSSIGWIHQNLFKLTETLPFGKIRTGRSTSLLKREMEKIGL